MKKIFIQNNNKKKIILIVFISIIMIIMMTLGVTLAIMTKTTEKRANNFTFGNVSIDLTETEWDNLTSGDKIVYPNKELKKNPVIKNTGQNDLYAYIEVKVPVGKVKTVNQDETINNATNQELLTYDINNGWEQIDIKTSNDYNTYLYVYNKVLSPNKETQSLFDKVTYINMLEGELPEGTAIDMLVSAYAIQSDYISNTDNLKEVFNKYISAS